MKKRVVFMGTPDFAVPCLKELAACDDFYVAGVFTQPDRPVGRGKKLAFSPVKAAALALGLQVYQPVKMRDAGALEALKELQPDIVVVVAYGQILPPAVISMPAFGCVNVHASLLPKYRGAAPIQRAVMNGETASGVCIMLMDDGLDTGAVLACRSVDIGPDETAGQLHDKLQDTGAELLIRTLQAWCAGNIKPQPQPEDGISYAHKISKADERIDWGETVTVIRNRVRGLNSWPGAYTLLNEKVVKVWKVEYYDWRCDARPGEIVAVNRQGIFVMCGDGCVVITEIQLAGGSRQAASSFVNGGKISKGDCFA